jgi:hypothetical protein
MAGTNVPLPDLPPLPALPEPPAQHNAIHVPPPVLPQLPDLPVQAMIPQGGMPALPKTPTPWVAKRNPSANVVQEQYVDTRLDELGAIQKPGKKQALAILEAMLLAKLPSGKKHKRIKAKELLRVYDAIERNLQSADLTINFKCVTWFSNPNPYDTYTQMYQRAIEANRMVLRNTDVNDADVRANVDNAITFPKSWQQGQAPLQRGLRPGRQSPQRIQKQMDTGTLQQLAGEGLPAFLAGNPHFNPSTKQVFLALNYGRRAHGSSINYGYSYIVAKSALKPRCLYYAQDTFLRGTGENQPPVDAGAMQVPYSNLGALLEANGDVHLRNAIFESCYEGKTLDDEVKTLCKYFLVEAHRFGEMKFSEHIDYMVISPKTDELTSIHDQPLWRTIVENAREFCQRNRIKLYQTD